MIVSPPLGMGDIFTLKAIEENNKLNIKTIIVNTELLKEYRLNSNNAILFTSWLIENLFPNTTIQFTEKKEYTLDRLINDDKYIITTTKLNVFKDIIYTNPIINEPYIVIHTKFRESDSLCSDLFKYTVLPQLRNYFQSYKCKYNIILLGERHVEENKETIKHKIFSLYTDLLLLKTYNQLIDYTEENLYSGNTSIDKFKRDINLIKNAKVNVTCGVGGNFCLSKFLSKKMIGFTFKSEISSKLLVNEEVDQITSDINQFFTWLNEI